MASIYGAIPFFVPDGNRLLNASSSVQVPATGAAATVTITDPADGSSGIMTVLEVLAAYSGAGTGTLTINQGTAKNQLSVSVNGTSVGNQLSPAQCVFPVGSGNVTVTLPAVANVQGILFVLYDIT